MIYLSSVFSRTTDKQASFKSNEPSRPSKNGKRFADIIEKNYSQVFRDPDKVSVIPNRSLAELRRTKAPAVLIEVGYHDNRGEAQWIRENIDVIAKALAKSVAEYFGII